MSVLNKISQDFKLKLKETLREKQDFYINSNGLFYKKKLKLSKDDINYEYVLNKLVSKLLYIFSKAKKELGRETEWLKLGLFIDWMGNDGIFKRFSKIYCFSRNDILYKYNYLVETLTDGGNCFNERDNHRKISFVVYENNIPIGDESEEESEEEEENNNEEESEEENEEEENNNEEENRLIGYQNSIRAVPTNEALPQQVIREINEGTDRFQESDFGLFWESNSENFSDGTYRVTYTRYGIERIERVENEDQTLVDIDMVTGLREIDQQETTTKETFRLEKCVICLDENIKPNILFCSCGHICICKSCKDLYDKKECPVCRGKK